MLSILSDVPNIRLLAVTIDYWFISEQTKRNIQRVTKNLPIDHIFFTPSWETSKRLYQETVKKTGELCFVCEGFLTSQAYQIALNMRIPSIAWGLAPHEFSTLPPWLQEIDMPYWERISKKYIEGVSLL